MRPSIPPTRIALALLALLLAPLSPASAASYTLSLHAEAALGKYTVSPHGDLAGVLANYDLKATSAEGTRFWTFCLESEVYFQSGRTVNAVASSSTDSLTGRDPLSNATAYLYEQFALGNLDLLLPGFTYDVPGGARLQKMVWWLEDESHGVQDPEMWSLLGSTFGDSAMDDYTGSSVGVLNLTKYDGPGGDSLSASLGTHRQDQLVYWGSPPTGTTSLRVPDTSATLALLGVSLGALGIFRRLGGSGSK